MANARAAARRRALGNLERNLSSFASLTVAERFPTTVATATMSTSPFEVIIPSSPAGSALAPPRADELPAVEQADVVGVRLAVIDYERTLDWIDAAVEARAREYVCVAAVH